MTCNDVVDNIKLDQKEIKPFIEISWFNLESKKYHP